MKNKAKWIWRVICLFLLLLITLIFLFRVAILMQVGKFMAPEGNYIADVAILEGYEFIDRGMVMSGMKLLSSGMVKRIVVVLHRIAPSSRPFALNEDYPSLVKNEMKAIGVNERDFQIIVTHIHHPITLVEAEGALETLSKEGVRSAILVSHGFHTRRSYLAYQHVGIQYHIKIYPSACFDGYQLDHWWSQEYGIRDFSTELLKLAYYLVRGYIPFKFNY